MKYLVIVVLAVAAACGTEETPAKTPPPATPEVETPGKPSLEIQEEKPVVPSVDAAKEALEKSIAETKALLEKKEADVKALLEKAKTEPMKAMQHQKEADKLRKEIAALQEKLEGYMKEAAGK